MPITALKSLLSAFKGALNTVGIDAGSFSLKVVYLSGSSPKYKLESWAYIPLDIETSLEQSSAETRNVFTTKLQTYLNQNRQIPKDITTGVDGPSVLVRTISIPSMAYQELAKTIQFEAEPFLPVNINECELGFHILGPSKDDPKKMDILLVAAKKDHIDSKLALINDIGIRTVVIDCNALAIYNAYELTYKNPETVVILNIGASITNMVLVENNNLKIVRDLAYGGNEFTKSLQRAMTVDFKGAEKLKSNYGLLVTSDEKEKTLADDKKDAIGVSIALTTPAKTLIGDIHRFIEFYLGQNPDAAISKILLSGGTANLKNLSDYIAKETSIPSEIFNPLSFVMASDIIPEKVAPSMAVALGLAMRKEKDYISKKKK